MMSSQRPSERQAPSAPLTVLTFVPYYLPGYKSGGPVRSIANLVSRLGDDLRFVIVTADRDSGDRAPYPDIAPGQRRRIGNADVIYVDAARSGPRHSAALVRGVQPDIIYLNSFFSRPFSMNVIALRHLRLIPRLPIVLAPRGEFSPGALQVKARRKRAFLVAARALRLHRDVLWQASTPLEADDIRRAVGAVERDGSSRIVVAPIIASPRPPAADAAAPAAARGKQPGHLRIAFLSRIAKKKNLLGALQILHGVRGSVEFSIYGPIEDQPYWRTCCALIDNLPANIRATHRGAVAAADVPAVLAAHDLFFLPTLGENYGHVIREALAAATPVLISDQTPWRNLAAAQVGWDLPLDRTEAFREVLETCIGMDAPTFARWSERAAAYAWRHAADDGAEEASRRLFSAAAAGRSAIAIGESGMINAS
jgi:glycosyltransferase involved in cell wall biosynthesis